MPPQQNMTRYLTAVYAAASKAISDANFHPEQAQLLHEVLAEPQRAAVDRPVDDPLSTVYLVAVTHRRRLDQQAYHVGAFCLFFILSADLFDDIQDKDLDGTPHAQVDDAIAINNAIALCFLANDQLRQAIVLDPSSKRRARYLEMHSRVSLTAVAGQHRDLMKHHRTPTPAEVLKMQQAKTSSMALLCESGALLGHCDIATQHRYRLLGEQLARFIQVRDDLRDIFGKAHSADLRTGKVNYPIACFEQLATPQQQHAFSTLVQQLPESLPQLRSLLYETGAVNASAQALERCRRSIHELVTQLPAGGEIAPLRLVLDIVDSLAESVYVPRPLTVSKHMWRPRGLWHEQVRAEQQRFCRRTRRLGLPPPPRMKPWHLPQWMYMPSKRTIFYPDVQGLAADVLPFQSKLVGIKDLNEVAALMHQQIPTVLAHEMFHFWRDGCGRLTSDHWHEEWAANRLAVAYAARYTPTALERSLALAERVLARYGDQLDDQAEAVLQRCQHVSIGAAGYQMGMLGVAVTTLEMIRRLAREAPNFEDEVQQLLAPPAAAALTA